MKRVCIIVLDSVGIGALPDAAEFGDDGAHTLGNIHARRPLKLPNLFALGLGNIEGSRLPSVAAPTAAYGRMAEKTKAKDTTSGHWELMGLIMDEPFRVFPEGFPPEFLAEWAKATGLPGTLGNKPASGTEIIKELGAEHIRTKKPLVYTSADSVFQVAAHEEVIPLAELYRICEQARTMLTGDLAVGRVIARPFLGEEGNFKRIANRKDYATPPVGETVLDALTAKAHKVLGIGKIEDIFSNRGITYANHTTNNADGIDATIAALNQNNFNRLHLPDENAHFAFSSGNPTTGCDASLIFTNLVDFDMLYGHRNDVEGYARALEYFDSRLPEVLAALRPDDILYITADHGCDPTTSSTDHSREYVPVLAYGEKVKPVNLQTRASFADLGATVYAYLTGEQWHVGEPMH